MAAEIDAKKQLYQTMMELTFQISDAMIATAEEIKVYDKKPEVAA